jgi:hypothetical protein
MAEKSNFHLFFASLAYFDTTCEAELLLLDDALATRLAEAVAATVAVSHIWEKAGGAQSFLACRILTHEAQVLGN